LGGVAPQPKVRPHRGNRALPGIEADVGLTRALRKALASLETDKGDPKMFLMLFLVLLVMWLMGFFAFHVAGGLIHLLLIVALVSLVMHFFRGSTA
jgi:hypothetical protein